MEGDDVAEPSCRRCGTPLTGYTDPRNRRYRACSEECKRWVWRMKARGWAHDDNEAPPSRGDGCLVCDKPARYRYCGFDCKELARHIGKATRIAIPDCATCGRAFVTRGWSPATYCPPCCVQHRKDRQRAISRRYHARKRTAVVEVFTDAEIHERDQWRCGICGGQVRKDKRFPHPLSPSIDHVIPLAKGGEHSRANVQSAHFDCNTRKQDGHLGPEQLRLIG